MSKFHIKQLVTICVVAIMVLWYSHVIAQTLTTDEPVPQKMWEVFLKIIFPAVWTGVAPYITSLIAKVVGNIPPAIKVVISTILGTVMAGVAGAIPDFPLTIESAATMGAAGGGTGQVLFNMTPKKEEPKVG